MRKNLKYLLFIGILVAIILGVVGYQYIWLPRQENPAVAFCKQQYIRTQNYSERVDCFKEVAVAELDPAICLEIYWPHGMYMEDPRGSTECMKAVIATASDDPSVYKKLRDPNLRNIFVYEIWGETHDIDVYFWDIVRNKTDLSIKHIFICDEIQTLYWKYRCYNEIAIAEQDISVCDKISLPSEKDYCYRCIAKKKLDPSICEKIVDIDMQSTCYAEVAELKQDYSICDRIKLSYMKDACYLSST